ncbi:hypothetical protein [Streptomyces sp. NPDC058155]|uniref:hypothetical protein n=1 Tax=Streptomyces sp. NPDC058155 TaxID=3346359 RepID=UPI0036F18050
MSRSRRSRKDQDVPPPAWGPSAPAKPQDPTASYTHQAEPERDPKKHRRIFFWFFLAVQILFVIWLITGISSSGSNADGCAGLTGDSLRLCEDGGDAGTAIGVGLIIGIWVAVDFILAVTYAVYRLARRQPRTS